MTFRDFEVHVPTSLGSWTPCVAASDGRSAVMTARRVHFHILTGEDQNLANERRRSSASLDSTLQWQSRLEEDQNMRMCTGNCRLQSLTEAYRTNIERRLRDFVTVS